LSVVNWRLLGEQMFHLDLKLSCDLLVIALAMPHNHLRCKPASFYYRKSVRESRTLNGTKALALMLVDELELLKEQVRSLGGIPERMYDATRIGPDARVEDVQHGEQVG